MASEGLPVLHCPCSSAFGKHFIVNQRFRLLKYKSDNKHFKTQNMTVCHSLPSWLTQRKKDKGAPDTGFVPSRRRVAQGQPVTVSKKWRYRKHSCTPTFLTLCGSDRLSRFPRRFHAETLINPFPAILQQLLNLRQCQYIIKQHF